jgi:hypothetical protein
MFDTQISVRAILDNDGAGARAGTLKPNQNKMARNDLLQAADADALGTESEKMQAVRKFRPAATNTT